MWIAQVGRIPLLLLDSDVPENDHDLRNVTDRLYGATRSTGSNRNCWRALEACVRFVRSPRSRPARIRMCSRMNEGHAGFLGVERIREFMTDDRLDFDTALTVVRSSTVFTTHTPVPAGIDLSGRDGAAYCRHRRRGLAAGCAGGASPCLWCRGRSVEVQYGALWDFGWRSANSVSLLHAAGSAARCSTNSGRVRSGRGSHRFDHQRVHGPTWAAPQWLELGRELAGSTEALREPSVWNRIDQVDGSHLVDQPQLRAGLVADVRAWLRSSWLERGPLRPNSVGLQPHSIPILLTIGFAAQVPTYKRLTLMLRDPGAVGALC